MNRPVSVVPPSGAESLQFKQMSGSEEIGHLFCFKVEFFSTQPEIELGTLIGKTMAVQLELPEGNQRFFHGLISDFRQVSDHGRYAVYEATVRPWLWRLKLRAGCRIFQQMSVPEIVKTILREHAVTGLRENLAGSYPLSGLHRPVSGTPSDALGSAHVGSGELTSFYLMAPGQDTTIAVEADAYDDQAQKQHIVTEISGPGVYMAGPEGLRLATESELSTILRAQGCGEAGQPCCMDAPTRNDGSLCIDDACRDDCGTIGAACCGGPGGECIEDAHCPAETCEACGGQDQPCCGRVGGTCGPLTTCSDAGTCIACGSDGEPCCDGGTCEGAACVEGQCRSDCGGAGLTCCGGFGGSCEDGAYCPSSENRCHACGEAGQECCGGFDGTCEERAYCPSGHRQCVACGQPGQECCGGFDGTCEEGAYCPSSSKKCVACGEVGQKCCGGYGGTCAEGGHCSGDQCVAD